MFMCIAIIPRPPIYTHTETLFPYTTRFRSGKCFSDYLKTVTRILLPICLGIAVLLMMSGMPRTMEGKQAMITLQGDTTQVSTGPVAAFVPIKHLGTNGGGFFGANSAHPLENPTYFTNMLEMVAQMLIPIAMVFTFGFFIKRRKMAWIIIGVINRKDVV